MLRRLNIEEEERQQEAKAKKEAEENAKAKEEITSSNEEITDSESILTESKQEEQEEKQDLESKHKQVDLDSLIEKIDSYELVEKYSLFDTLPAFQIFTDELIYDSETGEGDIELAKSLIENQKGEEYWDNMNPKDITKWEKAGVFTVAYRDNNDNFKEYQGYEDYSKSTIKQFLEENTTIAEELAEQYMPRDSKKKEQDSKDYEVEKKKDREIDFN